MAAMADLQASYPWTQPPLVTGAPMRLIALSALAFEISKAGGLGFIGAGSDVSTLDDELQKVKDLCSKDASLSTVKDVLPVGVGFLLWAGDGLLQDSLPLLERHKPAAIWLFAPREPSQLVTWTKEARRVTDGKTKIWVQIGTVHDAVETVKSCRPDVLVAQGGDAGGHGLEQCAGLISLLPEVDDAVSEACQKNNLPKPALVAAGGIMDSRGLAAALTLGASGITLGTRYLASPEANIAKGYRDAVVAASDGGVNTGRGKLYDSLRGTTDWPQRYGGRGVLNESWYDAEKGMAFEENKRLYDEAAKKGDGGWGDQARLTTYAGTGVGLIKQVQPAGVITQEVRDGVSEVLLRINRSR